MDTASLQQEIVKNVIKDVNFVKVVLKTALTVKQTFTEHTNTPMKMAQFICVQKTLHVMIIVLIVPP